MAASSIAFARFSFVDGACDAGRCLDMPVHAVPRDDDFNALVEQIRQVEGEAVSNPPLLFKVVVAAGLAITAAGGLGLASCILDLLTRLAA
jgi:hypothetical protein